MAKKKTDTQQTLINAAMAFGGGIGAEVVSDLIAKQGGDWVKENPEITEIAPAAVGVGLLYFLPGKVDPVAYGMIGASGAGMSDRLLNGFNRLNLNGAEADELARGRDFVEKMIEKGFSDPKEMQGTYRVEDAVIISDDNHDGMS